MRRRDFVSLAAGAALAVRTGRPAHAWRAPFGAPPRLPPPGIQLYTLRNAMRESVEATLDRVAGLGYLEVEFAGWFNRSAPAIRSSLANAGLSAPAAHVPLEALEGDRLAPTVAFAKEAGHRGLIVAWLPEALRGSLAAWHRLADRFNVIGAALREAGLGYAYHNHDFEFAPTANRVPFFEVVERTDPDLVDFELDLYWATRAGHDPLDLIERFPGRFALVHIKDSSGPPAHRMVDLGAGVIDFPAIFARSGAAGLRHGFVEHDRPGNPWAFAEAAVRYLVGLSQER